MSNPEPERSSPGKSADVTPVSTIMAKDLSTVRPELGIDDLEALLLAKGISGAPVVDDDGKPIGIVSKTDLLGRKSPQWSDRLKVRDIMMHTAFAVSENESIAKAAGLMAFEGVHRVAVVDLSGTVTGVVSPLDIMRWLAREHGYPIGNRR
jgi:predicted transcriptional regulator